MALAGQVTSQYGCHRVGRRCVPGNLKKSRRLAAPGPHHNKILAPSNHSTVSFTKWLCIMTGGGMPCTHADTYLTSMRMPM